MVEATTVGPLAYDTRDRLREFKHERELPNYDTALSALLDEVNTEE
jgi:hypothetical protein